MESASPQNQIDPRIARLKVLNRLECAGFWPRFFAITIDVFIISAIHVLIGISNEQLNSIMPSGQMSIIDVVWLVSWMFYDVIFLVEKGATPGKMLMRLKVVHLKSVQYPSFFQAIIREFGELLSCFTLCLGFLLVVFRKDKRALHDLIANTMVVKLPKQ